MVKVMVKRIVGISKNFNLAPCTYEKSLWCIYLRSIVSINRVVFRCALVSVIMVLAAAPLLFSQTPAAIEAPRGFAGIEIGMGIEEVKTALSRDAQFKFRGDPDVSLLASPNESLIETEGLTFIDRAYFQFYKGRLYTIILLLNPERIDHYTMYTTMVSRHGEPTGLDPSEAVWEFDRIRLALERPLSVKYIDTLAFGDILRQNARTESLNALSRERFLDQF